MNISNNISSLQTNQAFMNNSANNVANLNVSSSTTDLNKEIPNQILAQNISSADISAIKTQDEMLGSLLDIKA